jgi:hypothetical protein
MYLCYNILLPVYHYYQVYHKVSVQDLLDLVHNVILMSVYLDLETPGGWDFG